MLKKLQQIEISSFRDPSVSPVEGVYCYRPDDFAQHEYYECLLGKTKRGNDNTSVISARAVTGVSGIRQCR